uniref:RRM domain-containing protein n=1 Tax=Rhizophora mucronata TaxID=61149 RepID=A0A2P2MIE4_RHIMU
MDMAEKDDTEGRCPACRTPYDKEKIVGMASNCERLVAEINMERKKSQKAKIKPSEGRKQLSSVRVIQRNLVYVIGLPLNLADEDLLQCREFFGQYGKVLKVSLSRTAAGIIQQFPNNTCSVYITYSREEEAIRCIQSVHGFVLDGRSLKACFGTTKYCHAWLRNVPCTNPDCLYLHEIGSQEDSFTKDEIISAYTRSRVQQITAATSKMLRSGNTLPPPVDDYGHNTSLSASRPMIKNPSNSTVNSSKGSPPNGSLGRSIALPPAASWGMRTSNQLVGNSMCANGSSKTKTDAVCGALAFSTAVSNASQTSMLHDDMGIKVTWDEECEIDDGKSKLDSLKSAKQNVGADYRAAISEKPAENIIATPELTLSDPSSKNDWSTRVSPNITNSALHTAQSRIPEKVGTAATDEKIDKLCSDMPTLSIDANARSEAPGLLRTNSSACDFSMTKSPVSQGLQQPYSDHYREQFSSPAIERSARPVNGACVLSEQFDQRTDLQTQSFDESVSEVEDIISFDNQRLKDPEVVTLTNGLPNSSNSPPFSIHSGSHSVQDSETFGAVDLNADSLHLDNRGGNCSLLNASSNSVIPNGYSETVSSSARSERPIEISFLLPSRKEGRDIGRVQSDVGSISALDAGENSIISNILSLDPNAWDESLTSPQNLSKFLGENDQQPMSFRTTSSWKAQSNSQSRFSFAREEETRNQSFNLDSSVSIFGHLPRNHSFRQDLVNDRNSYMDKTGMGNGFVARNFEEPEIFTSSAPVFTSNKSSGGYSYLFPYNCLHCHLW